MNDVAVREIWRRLEVLEEQVTTMAGKLLFLEGRIRARLKEEAEAREDRWEDSVKRGGHI